MAVIRTKDRYVCDKCGAYIEADGDQVGWYRVIVGEGDPADPPPEIPRYTPFIFCSVNCLIGAFQARLEMRIAMSGSS